MDEERPGPCRGSVSRAGQRPLLALLLVAVMVVPGCGLAPGPDTEGTGPASPSSSTSSASDVGAEVVRYRRDEQRDVVQVKVTNHGPAPVQVTSVRLDTSTFTGAVQVDKDSTIGPGLAADLVVPLGAAACPAGPDTEHSVTLEVDGREVVIPVHGDVLDRVAARRCALGAVEDQVELSVSRDWDVVEDDGRPALLGTLLVAPQAGSSRLTVTLTGATTLFTVAEPATAEVLPGDGSLRLPVLLVMTRCDAHAVAEDKKGYLLPVRVAVDDAEAVLVDVAVPESERAPLQALIDRACR